MSTKLRLSLFLFMTLVPLLAIAEQYGHFVGDVDARWLQDGRTMKLLAPFKYVDPTGLEWVAPLGAVVDGASIPRFAWSIVGGPFEGKYRNASVIHDVACVQKTRPWEVVHLAFYTGMRAAEVDPALAKTMYAAVYHFGPRWDRKVALGVMSKSQVSAATDKILSDSAPQSQIAADIQTIPRSTAEILAHQEEKAYVSFSVTPPRQKLSENDFEKLKATIKERDLSLEEIRNYRGQN